MLHGLDLGLRDEGAGEIDPFSMGASAAPPSPAPKKRDDGEAERCRARMSSRPAAVRAGASAISRGTGVRSLMSMQPRARAIGGRLRPGARELARSALGVQRPPFSTTMRSVNASRRGSWVAITIPTPSALMASSVAMRRRTPRAVPSRARRARPASAPRAARAMATARRSPRARAAGPTSVSYPAGSVWRTSSTPACVAARTTEARLA